MADDAPAPDAPDDANAIQASADASPTATPSSARRITLVVAGAVLFLAGISSAWVIEVHERDSAQAARDAYHAQMADYHPHHRMHMQMLQSADFIRALTAALAAQGVDVTDAKIKTALAAALAAHMASMGHHKEMMHGAMDESMQSDVIEQMRRHHPEMFAR